MQGMLEYLDQLTLAHIRSLFIVLNNVTLHDTQVYTLQYSPTQSLILFTVHSRSAYGR